MYPVRKPGAMGFYGFEDPKTGDPRKKDARNPDVRRDAPYDLLTSRLIGWPYVGGPPF